MTATHPPGLGPRQPRRAAGAIRTLRLPCTTRRLWPLPVAAALAAAVWASGGVGGGPDPDQLLAQAQADARSGRYEEADKLLGRLALLRDPTPVDRLLRAQVAAPQGRVDDAVAELRQIPDDHPIAPLARLSEGQLEAREFRLRRAESAFLQTLELTDRATQARRELVYIYSVQRRLPELDAQLAALSDLGALDFGYLLHWGKVRSVPWDPAQDLPALRNAVAADPLDRHSRLALADALRRLGQFDEAGSTLSPLGEDDADALVVRAASAIDRGDLTAADAILDRGPQDHPGLAEHRGGLALARHDGDAASRHFRIAHAADPLNRAVLQGLATALTLTSGPEAARPYRDAILRHDAFGALIARASRDGAPADPDLPRELGLACAGLGRPREARAWLRLVIESDPLDAEAQQALYALEHDAGMAPPGAGAAGAH